MPPFWLPYWFPYWLPPLLKPPLLKPLPVPPPLLPPPLIPPPLMPPPLTPPPPIMPPPAPPAPALFITGIIGSAIDLVMGRRVTPCADPVEEARKTSPRASVLVQPSFHAN